MKRDPGNLALETTQGEAGGKRRVTCFRRAPRLSSEGASLEAQWLTVRPTQGAQARCLAGGD